MEALAPAYYPTAPHTQTSHLHDPRTHPTRPVPPPVMHIATHDLASNESSQDSLMSAQSATSSNAMHATTNGSNASQLTDYSESAKAIFRDDKATASRDQHLQQKRPNERNRTPDNQTMTSRPYTGDASLASPMSLTSPITTNGSKRTASGHVKNAASLPHNSYTAPVGTRARGTSMSSTGSRAGELAATLKARLAYAAAKVQHGWEHKSIDEVERLAVQQSSLHSYSTSALDQRPGTSGLSNGTANLSMYEPYPYPYAGNGRTSSPPSKRHSASLNSLLPPNQTYAPSLQPAPRLQPPADILPTGHTRQIYTPPLPHKQPFSSAMSPPRTPLARSGQRPGMLWGEVTTEAERDALQALSQLGSPHTSQFTRQQSLSQGSSSQTSPLRSEFATPRRVTFARSTSSDSGRHPSSESSMSEEPTL